jgi:hypothetical protein
MSGSPTALLRLAINKIVMNQFDGTEIVLAEPPFHESGGATIKLQQGVN